VCAKRANASFNSKLLADACEELAQNGNFTFLFDKARDLFP
jgi:hypothetical protein